MRMRALVTVLIGATIALSAGTVAAGVNVSWTVTNINGANEVPPNGSAGTGSMVVDVDSGNLSVTFNVSYSGLTGTLTAAHIHGLAGPGVPAGVVFPFAPATGASAGSFSGTWNSSSIPPMTLAVIDDIKAGNYYLNLHSTVSPGGELRGQTTLVAAQTPIGGKLMLLVMTALILVGGYMAFRRRATA